MILLGCWVRCSFLADWRCTWVICAWNIAIWSRCCGWGNITCFNFFKISIWGVFFRWRLLIVHENLLVFRYKLSWRFCCKHSHFQRRFRILYQWRWLWLRFGELGICLRSWIRGYSLRIYISSNDSFWTRRRIWMNQRKTVHIILRSAVFLTLEKLVVSRWRT